MEIVEIIALSMGLAWASGINLYAAIFVLGWLGGNGSLELPAELQVCSEPAVMAAAGFMYFVEFFADKVPGVDTGWDTIHTFIRIPAGAILAAGAVGELGQSAEVVALLLGGTLSAASHATKAGGRILINTSPEPVTNWTASIAEDIAVVASVWSALIYPELFLVALCIVLLIMAWLLPRIWQGVKFLATRLRQLFMKKPPESYIQRYMIKKESENNNSN
ncbi:Putative transmembrane protein [hydrothermal vent metagenome]|uniref:Transmembrane protein n=1 Tax=hydrothermal vent metagenome TaxID=652676 RepID=A0A3B0ZBY3_9ZZZZ